MKKSYFWFLVFSLMMIFTYTANSIASSSVLIWGYSLITYFHLRSISYGKFSWFYFFMTILFFLGSWFKAINHQIFDYNFIEPTGAFDYSRNLWDEYYLYAASFSLAFILSKIIFKESKNRRLIEFIYVGKKISFQNWVMFLLIIISIYSINGVFKFYATGVGATINLPLGLNAPIAFFVLAGISLLTSDLFNKSLLSNKELTKVAVVSVLFIALIASISTLSRASVFIFIFPFIFSVLAIAKQKKINMNLTTLAVFAPVALLLSVIVVSILRMQTYYSSSIDDTFLVEKYINESISLIYDRWVGAEAILVGVSEPTHSIKLFFELLFESKTSGVNSIYQVMAGSTYTHEKNFLFLTLPGYMGIISLSGSYLFIFLVTFLIMFLGIIYEFLFVNKMLHGQQIVIATAAMGLTNSITQMAYPILVVFYLVQLSFFLGLIKFYNRNQYIKYVH